MKAKHGLVNKYSVTLGALVSAVLLIIVGAHAQSTTDSTTAGTEPITMSAADMALLQGLSEAQLAAFISALDATPEIAYTNLLNRGAGTFYSLQHPDWPPLPADLTGSPVWPMKGFDLLNDIYFNYPTVTKVQRKTTTSGTTTTMTTMTTMTTVDTNSPPSPSGSTTNTYVITNSISFTTPDYGTNLWISQWSSTSGGITGIASNTMANVEYDFMTNSDLTTTNWGFSGQYFYGSTTTNWTAMPLITIDSTSNLFFRLRSDASSDGSGLPTWWELQYFGTTGIDPNADPMGDGWSNIQKYQDGMNPNVFYTPPTPQGVTVQYNSIAGTAKISWVPSPGPVVSYTITDSDGDTFTVAGDTTSYTDNVSSDQPDPSYLGTIPTTYTVTANYSNNSSPVSSPASSAVPLEANTFSGVITSGPEDLPTLVVQSMPANTVAIRLTELNYTDYNGQSNNFIVTNLTISVSDLTNGMYALPILTSLTNGEYNAWVGQAVGGDGSMSATAYLTDIDSVSSDMQPFYDGRVQLKQDLIFKLRAAGTDKPFKFYDYGDYSGDYLYEFYDPPTNYVESSFLHVTDELYTPGYFNPYDYYAWHGTLIDPLFPFIENNLLVNFTYSSSNITSDTGCINTGVNYYDDPNGDVNLALAPSPRWSFQQPTTQWVNQPGLLATNQTQWLCSIPVDTNYGSIYSEYDENAVIDSSGTYNLTANSVNLYGLPFLSEKLAFGSTSGRILQDIPDGGSYTSSSGTPPTLYADTKQPEFRTVEYDFWNATPVWDQSLTRWIEDWLPGSHYFSPTNQSQQFITSPGTAVQIAGYAKLEVTNSAYTGVYAYLGQYFQQAYQVDANGDVTTNTTGVLSPYGSFTPTEPGDAALVTMPDVDTGEQGTCIVHCVSLQLDKNHDGVMDLSFNGPDATSEASPFVFWANANMDRTNYDSADNAIYEDGVTPSDPGAISSFTGLPTPDYDYRNALGERVIPTKRDLEDFARLWVYGITSNLLANLPSDSMITLNWGDVGNPNSNNPTIDIFQAADPNGGIGYLTNETIAAEQVNSSASEYVGRLGPGGSIQLNSSSFSNYWAGNHFIWCGVSNGIGQLTLTITDSTGSNVLAQSSQWIQIKDIKEMYERWSVGDNPNLAPTNMPYLAKYDLPKFTSAFQYTQPTDTNTPYILFVHGWNMSPYDKDIFAETAFKRLYWQGYQGRFGAFRWPTDYGFDGTLLQLILHPTEKDNYDKSEYEAWQSGEGLLNLLKTLDAEYPGHVFMLAHSMGNIVANEALRLAGTNQVINTYIASQAAVSAHTYDTNVPNYSFYYPPWSYHADTPNIYGNWFLGNNGNGARRVINFFNVNDYALQRSVWQLNQLFKPDQLVSDGLLLWDYGYNGTTNDPSPWNNFYKVNNLVPPLTVNFDIVGSLLNRYEVMGYDAQSWTTALGATPNIQNVAATVDLQTLWPSPDPLNNNYASHYYHSAEFRGDTVWEWNYWNTVLHSSRLGFNINY